MAERLLDSDASLRRTLEAAAKTRRCVFFAGLPGVGKTLMVQQLGFLARESGRRVHMMQFDVARSAFERPDVLRRYPEVDGVTNAALRRAVGLWSRPALSRWADLHPGEADLLIGETPLIGNRFVELAQVHDDPAEVLLASEAALFLIPVPSRGVRRAIEAARERDSRAPTHDREAANAIPTLVTAIWQEIGAVAVTLGLAGEFPHRDFDPDLYAAVYRRLLRHRHSEVLQIDRILPVSTSAYEVGAIESELVPTADEVNQFLAQVEALKADELGDTVARWYEV